MATDKFLQLKGFHQIEGGHIFFFVGEAVTPQKVEWEEFYKLFLFQTKDFISSDLKPYHIESLSRQGAIQGTNNIGSYIQYWEYKDSIPSAAYWAKKALIESGKVGKRVSSLGNKKGAFKGDLVIPTLVLQNLKAMAGESMSSFNFPL